MSINIIMAETSVKLNQYLSSKTNQIYNISNILFLEQHCTYGCLLARCHRTCKAYK